MHGDPKPSRVRALDDRAQRGVVELGRAGERNLHERRARCRETVDGRELVDDLRRYQSGQMVGVHRYTSRELFKRWARKHKGALAVAALSFVVLVVVGVIAISRVVSANRDAQRERDIALEQSKAALEARAAASHRFKLATAMQYADALIAYLRTCRGMDQVTVAGSFRRMRETVGDLDIVISAAAGSSVMERFCEYDEVRETLARGETRASVVLKAGLQVDVRLVPRESYGAALHYFTGSKAHNIAIRRIGQSRGLKINEYGVFRGARRIAGETEASVYDCVGLPFIAPELREDRGEIEAARRGDLPNLVTRSDLRGDLHMHTKATDGHHTIEEMATAAQQAGLEYIAITEHSRRLTVARGLDPRRLAKQVDEIDRINEKLDGITILKGIEVDILEDGSLDLPDSALKRLDVVVGALHSRFDLPRAKQTARIMRAMENHHLGILAHPTARLIGEREPCDIDMLKILRHAKNNGCALELNAHPDRLDLNDVHCQMAREEGVLVCINSDAHSTGEFANLAYGIGQARRGWLEPKDVLNTRPLGELKSMLGK